MIKGLKAKGMAEAAVQDNLNPMALAIASGYTFIGRGYALQPRSLAALIAQAVKHRGTAFIDILQTCPVYNDLYDKEWYGQQLDGSPRLYQLDDTDYDPYVHDPENNQEVMTKKVQAIAKSYEWGDRIPLGCLYKIDLPTFEDQLAHGRARGHEALAKPNLWNRDVTKLIDALR